MGILGMSRLIADASPDAIKEADLKSLFGRRIAIDASMCIYQFLIAIRNEQYMMTNESGETTSHLVGLFYRTIKMLETGIKPVYVFDGKAPKLKCGELMKRAERRNEAKEKLEEAKEVQDIENIQRFNKRLVRVTRKMTEDCKRLLELLGIPVVQAPSEAEAQCVQLCKEGLVYAAATEDMDALTFGCPRLVRNLTSTNNEKIKEFQIERVLHGLELTQNEFIDLSILMGCDYCDNIRGIGPKTGLELIRKHKSIEAILEEKFGITEFVDVEVEYNVRGKERENEEAGDGEGEDVKKEIPEEGEKEIKAEGDVSSELGESIDSIKEEIENDQSFDKENEEEEVEEEEKMETETEENESNDKKSKMDKKPKRKMVVPEQWPFRGARKLFQEPYVLRNAFTDTDLRMKDVDEEGLVEFLCKQNGFSEERVRGAIKRAKEAKGKGSQTRIDSFFKAKPSSVSTPSNKRNATDSKQKSQSGAKRGRPRR